MSASERTLPRRDCLAAPGTTVADQTVVSNGVAPSNKDKICYKCSQQGHVRNGIVTTHVLTLFADRQGVPSECRIRGLNRLRMNIY